MPFWYFLTGGSTHIWAWWILYSGPLAHLHHDAQHSRDVLADQIPQSASYHTLDTAQILCYSEPLVNSFVFPSDILVMFTRHHQVEEQCDMCSSRTGRARSCSDEHRELCQVSREAATQVILFGICTSSSSYLQLPCQWSWGKAVEQRGERRGKNHCMPI